jgi:hypothetical protein
MFVFVFNRRSSPSYGSCLYFRRSVRSQGAFLPGSGARPGNPEGLQEHPPALGGDHSPGGDGPDEPVPGFRTSETVQMDSKPVQVCLLKKHVIENHPNYHKDICYLKFYYEEGQIILFLITLNYSKWYFVQN